MRWDEVNARARGLATHLLDRQALAGLAAARDWADLLGRLAGLGYPLEVAGGGALDPTGFDRAVTLATAARLDLLGRWLGSRRAVLAVVLEEEERSSLRALLRGAAQGASPGARLRMVLPTPGLPRKTLERLAHAASVPELVRQLAKCGHPAGRALRVVLDEAPEPGLRSMEWALTRLFTERARRAAESGGPVLRRYVAELVDQENLWTVLLGAPADAPGAAPEFLEGGSRLTKAEFVRLRAERDREACLTSLERSLRGTALGMALAPPVELPALPARAAAARVRWLRGVARRDPLGPAVVLGVLERMRAEARILRGMAWGIAFGAPFQVLEPMLPEAA